MISSRLPETGRDSGNSIFRDGGATDTDGLELRRESTIIPATESRHKPMSTVFNFTFVPWFRSVAPYIHKFRNQTFVVGVCGEAIAAGKLQHLAQDLAHDPEHGREDRAGARLSPAGQRAAPGQGPRRQVFARHAHHRRGGAGLRAGGRRPAALRDRGGLQPGPAQHADGRLHRARDLAATSSPRGRWAFWTAWISSTPAWCARWMWPASPARWTWAPWCCCRRSVFRPPARPST